MSIRLGKMVTEDILGAHRNPKMSKYALLKGDILIYDEEDGTYMKECPGVAIGGFILTEEQVASLEDVKFENNHLAYRVIRNA